MYFSHYYDVTLSAQKTANVAMDGSPAMQVWGSTLVWGWGCACACVRACVFCAPRAQKTANVAMDGSLPAMQVWGSTLVGGDGGTPHPTRVLSHLLQSAVLPCC
jgi:hypothetical protein